MHMKFKALIKMLDYSFFFILKCMLLILYVVLILIQFYKYIEYYDHPPEHKYKQLLYIPVSSIVTS